MNRRSKTDHLKDMVWVMRIYAAIIIAVLLISDFTSWLSDDTAKLVIMLVALLTIGMSFQPYFAEHKKVRRWIIGILVVLLLLGLILVFIVQ